MIGPVAQKSSLKFPIPSCFQGIVVAVYADWHTNQLAFCFLLEQTLVSLVRESPGLVETDWVGKDMYLCSFFGLSCSFP